MAINVIPERRRIRQNEAEVIQAALDGASVGTVDQAVRAAIPDLEVVARCECGCASVDFEGSTSQERSGIVADATGRTTRGGQVGIIVWGRSDTITALEIYDLGAGDDDLVLPVLTSVIPWDRQETQ